MRIVRAEHCACSASMKKLVLIDVEGDYAICKASPEAAIPSRLNAASFCSITRTRDELSIICPAALAPAEMRVDAGWKLLKIPGPFDFSEVGVLLAVLAPLAEAKIAILSIS